MGEIFTPGAFAESGGGPLYLQLHRLIAEAIASGVDPAQIHNERFAW